MKLYIIMNNKLKLTIINEIKDVKKRSLLFTLPNDDHKDHDLKSNNLDYKIFNYSFNNLLYSIQIWHIFHPLNNLIIVNNNFSDTDAYIIIINSNSMTYLEFIKRYDLILKKRIFLILFGESIKSKLILQDLKKHDIILIRSFIISNIDTNKVRLFFKEIINNNLNYKRETLYEVELDDDYNEEKSLLENPENYKNKLYKFYHKYKCF
jgi:hypothetical protein